MINAAMMENFCTATMPDRSRRSFDLEILRLADGSIIRVAVEVVAGTGARPCLVVIAGVHGDEVEGILALADFWELVQPEEMRGRLVMVPVANPSAFAVGQRYSPIDGLDLNRTFPGKADGRPSEQLAERLFSSVVADADFIFTMHSWFTTGTNLPFVEASADGSEVAERSIQAALASGFERIRLTTWPPGLLIRVANEAGIPGMEAEIGNMGVSRPENRAMYHHHLIALMRHLGMLKGEPSRHPKSRCFHGDHIRAPQGGILRLQTKLGANVVDGDILGTLRDIHGKVIQEVRAPFAGVVVAHREMVSVNSGDHLFTLFRGVESSD